MVTLPGGVKVMQGREIAAMFHFDSTKDRDQSYIISAWDCSSAVANWSRPTTLSIRNPVIPLVTFDLFGEKKLLPSREPVLGCPDVRRPRRGGEENEEVFCEDKEFSAVT